MMGEVKPDRAAAYLRRWLDEAAPLITANALRQIAAMPGIAPGTRRYLLDRADAVERGEPNEVRWALVRNCQAEARFFSLSASRLARALARSSAFELGMRIFPEAEPLLRCHRPRKRAIQYSRDASA